MSEKAAGAIDPTKLNVVLATDCGSTTTKAVLFEKTADGWRQTFRGEAPTTVEKPVANVTIGARNAFSEVQELSGRKILRDEDGSDSAPPFVERNPSDPANGIDLYVSTSSAGGGLQMVVAGVVGNMTTQSAERAALGAGAIVMDAISLDDGRETHDRVQRIRHLRPDIVLIAGGTDGGTVDHPLELAETVLQADPRPRFGDTLQLPVIYAANKNAMEQAKVILEKRFAFVATDNIRPALDRENLAPARDAIHEIFLHHVMSHAPGYKSLLGWTPLPILPTPAAVGDMVQRAASHFKKQILAVDIGGATTDVFSVFSAGDEANTPVFNRTVSANLGMSYSVTNVLLEAGEANIQRWLPFALPAEELRDRLRNKMIRPTTIPQTLEDLLLEQAVCREALRLAFLHHRRLAVGLRGGKKQRTIGDFFQQDKDLSLIDMFGLDLIIGSGGVLSHAPDRRSSALMMIDAYEPLGVTELAVDSIFMMPHLGVLSSVHPEAAVEVFLRDCLVPLGTVVAPSGKYPPGTLLLEASDGSSERIELRSGDLFVRPLAPGEERELELVPAQRQVDVGAGPGEKLKRIVRGGHAGLVFDGRSRPIQFPADAAKRVDAVAQWHRAMGIEVSVR